MQYTMKSPRVARKWRVVLCTVALWGALVLSVVGQPVESWAGWLVCPPQLLGAAPRRAARGRHSPVRWHRPQWRLGWLWLQRSWSGPLARSEALLLCLVLTGREQALGLCGIPWVAWGWQGVGVLWPQLWSRWGYRRLEGLVTGVSRWVVVGGIGLWLSELLAGWAAVGPGLAVVGGVAQPQVQIQEDPQGTYHVQLQGQFELHLNGQVEMYKRLLIIFLGLLEVPGETRGSRRTRDGRTPFVRQTYLARQFGVPQPNISRWNQYWLTQDWGRMLSQRWGVVVTPEVRQQVIASWVRFPWWSARQLRAHLQRQGSPITVAQVQQIGQESGWTQLRQRLQSLYHISPDSFRPRDGWLVEQLLAQVEQLLTQLEAVGAVPTGQQSAVADLQALGAALELQAAPQRRSRLWLQQVERLLLGSEEPQPADTVRCLYCGTSDVSRKSRQPRVKRYVDAQGNACEVEVYRYYCHNPACEYQTFTDLPPHLLPYSRYTLQHHLEALLSYEWAHGVYHCTSRMLGVSKMTAYRWVSAFGYQLLPVAALFGVVRSSGVIGIDEKYVLVPKNDKPDAKMKRWMYVYLAVDSYSYDLLHIEIYPYNTKRSAQAFLLALRAKGYRPRVIVTDLRADYRDTIAQVFPQATHHTCIFHALQAVHQHLKDAYGTDYRENLPQVAALQDAIHRIFAARTKRTAWRRYQAVLAQRETFVASTPEAAAVFDFLERHWPSLVNAIESQHIPATNNATEQVIRIFNQHYKTFCGFESLESARLYLGVFEKVYRFTPFSDDAQERIRGKCPLELAGYEVRKLPIAHLFRGLALQWPPPAFQEMSLT